MKECSGVQKTLKKSAKDLKIFKSNIHIKSFKK